jgi:hypothetical protein
MDSRTARLPSRVPGLRWVSHLCNPAVPGARSARTGRGPGGFPLPAARYRGVRVGRARCGSWLLAAPSKQVAAGSGGDGRGFRVPLSFSRPGERV